MVRIVSAPSRIPVPGGKVIDEYVGRVATSSDTVSVAHMTAPAGWTEPAQAPAFDEITLVLRGSVHVESSGETLEICAGQAIMTEKGERVRYSAGAAGAEYVAICLPAFAAELAGREAEA